MSPVQSPRDWFAHDFFKVPVIAVLRGLDPKESVRYATRAWNCGVEHVEIPIQTPDALPSLQAVAYAASERGLSVGAGTVTTPAQLESAQQVGVSFTVSPGLDARIVEESIRRGIPHLPGVATATEVLQAQAMGLSWLKAFPASVLGPAWITAVKGPFPNVDFVATGGVTAGNARSFLDCGASVVGLSSAFASDEQLDSIRELIGSAAAAPFR